MVIRGDRLVWLQGIGDPSEGRFHEYVSVTCKSAHWRTPKDNYGGEDDEWHEYAAAPVPSRERAG
jgi:hypothetical protein